MNIKIIRLLLLGAALSIAASNTAANENWHTIKVVHEALGCYGPGGLNSTPPCETTQQLNWLPERLIEEFELNDGALTGKLKGELTLKIQRDRNGNESALYRIQVTGMPENFVPTVWVTYCNPRDRQGPPPFIDTGSPQSTFCSHQLLRPFPGLGGPADVRGRPSVPLQSLFAGVTNGMGPEANVLKYVGNDTWMLEGRLEWNPLKPNQGPVVNSVEVNQANRRPDQNTQANLPVIIPSDDPLNVQPQCCFGGNPNEGFSRNQPTAGAYMRVFDHDIDPETNRKSGYQKLDKNGNPVLVKSPLPAWIFTLITHTDKTTHGLHSGGPGGGAALLGMFLLCDPADGGPHCMDE